IESRVLFLSRAVVLCDQTYCTTQRTTDYLRRFNCSTSFIYGNLHDSSGRAGEFYRGSYLAVNASPCPNGFNRDGVSFFAGVSCKTPKNIASQSSFHV